MKTQEIIDFLEEVCFDRSMDYMNNPTEPMRNRLENSKKVYETVCGRYHVTTDQVIMKL